MKKKKITLSVLILARFFLGGGGVGEEKFLFKCITCSEKIINQNKRNIKVLSKLLLCVYGVGERERERERVLLYGREKRKR